MAIAVNITEKTSEAGNCGTRHTVGVTVPQLFITFKFSPLVLQNETFTANVSS